VRGTCGSGAAIEYETSWRRPAGLDRDPSGPARIIAARWRGTESRPREVSATTAAGYHTVAIALRRMNIAFTSEGRLLHDGGVMPGAVQVSRPGERVGAVFDGAFDLLHLFVPEDLLADCREATGGRVELLAPGFAQDAVIERLAQALLQAEDAGEFGRIYAETLSLAIVSRLLGLQNARGHAGSGARIGLLPKWRLRRVMQFVDANLDQALSLADLAQVAGLSRMHFAAQFRAATDLRPHEYILRRRIEHAQDRLASTAEPLVEVAMSVGFRTQAHFSTVFKRFAGATPMEWRRQARSFGFSLAPSNAAS
jgi:AraC-like DNA-binding protein